MTLNILYYPKRNYPVSICNLNFSHKIYFPAVFPAVYTAQLLLTTLVVVSYLNYKPALIISCLVNLSINNTAVNKLDTSLCIPVGVLLKDTLLWMVLLRQKYAVS